MNPSVTRREFLKTSTTAAAVGALAGPFIATPGARAEINSETLKIGLIGCGGRGTGAASQALRADKNVVLTAVGDAFEDRARKSLEELKGDSEIAPKVMVDADHQFAGLDAYQKVINSGVDVVLLATPPGFRPLHLEAAVAAGKHIFCEKPMAVDAPGARTALAAVEEARKKKLSIVSGFVSRYGSGERALYQQIHDGAIGEIVSLYNTFNVGSLWVNPRQPGWTDLYYQMRNWYYFTWLGGDHIVEQAIHPIDKMQWAMKDVAPLKAIGHGGRQVRTGPEFGHIYDHFAIVYEYPNGVKGFHFCRQQPNTASAVFDTFTGTKGTARNNIFSSKEIKGEKNWKYSGPAPNMFQVEHDELFASIRSGKPINDGEWMIRSTLVAIMGRMAAYTGQEVTWDMMMESKEKLMPEKLDWNMTLPEPPVAIPGKTPFV